MVLVSVGEARQRTAQPGDAYGATKVGQSSGDDMALEPGGPAAASSARQVGSLGRSRGCFPSAWVVEPFGLTRGWRRSPAVAAFTPCNAAVWPLRLYRPLHARSFRKVAHEVVQRVAKMQQLSSNCAGL